MQKFENITGKYLQLSKADQEQALQADELETFAMAAYLTGRDEESFQILERTFNAYLQQTKINQAVRCAFWLGLMLMNAGQRARSGGWLAKGERLLKEESCQDCAETGLFIIPSALGALSAGNAAQAVKLFEHAATIGEQFCDADLIALGRLGLGQAMIQQGAVAEGKKLLDEMMIKVETETIFPILCGIIYCAVIETCRKIWDLDRAQEWTMALTRWCEAQPHLVPFRGQCLVQRAEIIQLQGEWKRALQETYEACEVLTRQPGKAVAGEAFYRKAELHRLMGNSEEAENCYHEAGKWGKIPQPGLALLRLAQGRYDEAETSISNTLRETTDIKKRSELLPVVVRILIAINQTVEAKKASKELEDIAGHFDVPYLYALSAYCCGAVSLAEGRIQPALEDFQKAMKFWNNLHLPYEAARTRELKGLAYQKLDDKDNAEVELTAAMWVFEQLHAIPDMERVNRLLSRKGQHDTHGLTLRELQVLHRVASGKTNKSIGGELYISERTVDRHVSNIFSKLGVSSRVEATAFAIRKGIMDPGT